jgi:hypothetical protein
MLPKNPNLRCAQKSRPVRNHLGEANTSPQHKTNKQKVNIVLGEWDERCPVKQRTWFINTSFKGRFHWKIKTSENENVEDIQTWQGMNLETEAMAEK